MWKFPELMLITYVSSVHRHPEVQIEDRKSRQADLEAKIKAQAATTRGGEIGTVDLDEVWLETILVVNLDA
jgi:hypothetical protein